MGANRNRYCETVANHEKRKQVYSHIHRLHDEVGRSKTLIR